MLQKLSLLAFLALTLVPAAAREAAERPPNVVLIFLDDSGWSDFPPFGSPAYETPNVAQLAADGCRFDRFYVPQAICSASRAALLTGCYPGRTKIFGALAPRLRGLDPSFKTLAETLKERGYATGFFGKWHLGDHEDTRPPARGFDESSGLMYSNDMWEFHPENPEFWGQFPLQYWKNGEITIDRVTKEHQRQLTTWSTEDAVDFISRHKDDPFFVYVPHAMPHVPLFVSDKFEGKSGRGLYGDVMMEIDWSVGEIMKALKDGGVEEETLVIFTSDNGPWISYGNHAGSTPFREAKGTSFDGGLRSACLMKFPGRIPAGSTSDRTLFSIDLMPTIAALAGAEVTEEAVDGKNLWPLIRQEPGAENPHRYYAFSNGNRFEGVMSGDGRWKLHLEHPYRTLVEPGQDGAAGTYRQATQSTALYDMENDPNEREDVKDRYPDVYEALRALADQHRERFYVSRRDERLVAEDAEAFDDLFPENARVETLATGLQFTEGPVWVGGQDGYLVFSDIPADRLYRLTRQGGLTVFREPSRQTNGNTLDREGRLIHCEHGGRQVSMTKEDGTTVSLVAEHDGKKLNSPNDAVVKSDGTIWFTDPDYGLGGRTKEQEGNFVYPFDPSSGDIRPVVKDFDKPNGLAFSPDESKLYVADSGRPRHIRVFEVGADGSLGPERIFAEIDRGGPDGIRCDSEGRVWSSSGDGAQVFDPDGRLLARVRLPKGGANLCFGGPKGTTLFVTARDGVYAVETRARDAKSR